MRRAVLAAVLLLAAVPAAPAAGAGGWKSPQPWPGYLTGGPGLTSDASISLQLATNARWEGATAISPAAPGGEGTAAVWARTCSRGAQTIVLHRTIVVPGPLVNGVLSIGVGSSTGPASTYFPGTSEQALAGFKLLVNHRDALGSEAGERFQRDGFLSGWAIPELRLKPGSNEITLQVTKRPTPKGAGECGAGSRSALGVVATLTGAFPARLALAEVPAESYKPAGNGGTIRMTVSNPGPGAVVGGTFTFSMCCAFELLTPGNGGPVPPHFAKCTGERSVTCRIVDFPPKGRVTVTVLYHLDTPGAPPPTADRRLTIGWGVSPVGGNGESRSAVVWLCAAGSTRPGCPR